MDYTHNEYAIYWSVDNEIPFKYDLITISGDNTIHAMYMKDLTLIKVLKRKGQGTSVH